MRLASPAATALAAVLAAGCSGGPTAPLAAPAYDPAGMARAALARYDANGNGAIDGTELDACPALKAALPGIDTNGDKAISGDELRARFEAYRAAGVGVTAVAVTVKRNGRPLPGATVRFVPDDCMQGAVRGGSGTSDANGAVRVTDDGAGVPGLACGLYRIVVSKPGADGREELPTKFNAQTTLGREVYAAPRGGGATVDLNLK